MSVADELTKLTALRDSGALTTEEFDQQRAMLLAASAASPSPAWGVTSQAGPGMTCGRCSKPLSPAWRGKCSHCGATYAQYPPLASVPGAVPVVASSSVYRKGQGMSGPKRLAVVGGVLVGLVVLGLAVNRPTPFVPSVGVPSRTAAPAADRWVPAGFKTVPDDDSIAYRWLDENEFSCDIADRCWGMEVIPHDGCASSLYVELSIEDSAGTAVGLTNDTVGAVKADQKARLVFDNYETGGRKARITDVSCY